MYQPSQTVDPKDSYQDRENLLVYDGSTNTIKPLIPPGISERTYMVGQVVAGCFSHAMGVAYKKNMEMREGFNAVASECIEAADIILKRMKETEDAAK